jgi:cytochrome d ubiquinol oxidase subunit I
LAPLQIWLGDVSGRVVAQHQPPKLAAIESHWQTNAPGTGAPLKVLAWPDEAKQDNDWTFIEIPCGLSLLITHTLTGQVKGLRDFPREDQPPVAIPFFGFRLMAGVGFLLFFLVLWTLWAWGRGRLTPERLPARKWLLWAWVASVPLGYLAVIAGWWIREVGRQPWVIYGLLRTSEGASQLPAAAVATSLLIYAVIYTLLFCVFTVFAWRILKQGPDLESKAPLLSPAPAGPPPKPMLPENPDAKET